MKIDSLSTFLFLDIFGMLLDDYNKFMNIINDNPSMINNLRNDDDLSLLMWAACNNINRWKILINIEQDFSIVDKNGYNLFRWISINYDDDTCNEMFNDLLTRQVDGVNNMNGRALHNAAFYNRHKSIRTLLRFPDIDVNVREYGILPEEYDNCDETTKQIIREFRQK